jgi:hypothetical protein
MCWTNPSYAKFLWEQYDYVNADAYGPLPQSLEIRTFLDSKHLHCYGVADAASFRSSFERNHPNLAERI